MSLPDEAIPYSSVRKQETLAIAKSLLKKMR
jgi:hypothetical protein